MYIYIYTYMRHLACCRESKTRALAAEPKTVAPLQIGAALQVRTPVYWSFNQPAVCQLNLDLRRSRTSIT